VAKYQGFEWRSKLAGWDNGIWEAPVPLSDEVKKISGRTLKSVSHFHPKTKRLGILKKALDTPDVVSLSSLTLAATQDKDWVVDTLVGSSTDRIVTVGELAHTVARFPAVFRNDSEYPDVLHGEADGNGSFEGEATVRDFYRKFLAKIRTEICSEDKDSALSHLLRFSRFYRVGQHEGLGSKTVATVKMHAEFGLTFDDMIRYNKLGFFEPESIADIKKQDIDAYLLGRLVEDSNA
jgi:hypothetical protein